MVGLAGPPQRSIGCEQKDDRILNRDPVRKTHRTARILSIVADDPNQLSASGSLIGI